MEFPIEQSELYTALQATNLFCQSRKPFYILSDSAMQDMFVPPTEQPEQQADTVVIGLAESKLNYENLNTAFRILHNSDNPQLIALNIGRYHKTSTGNSVGPGCFVKGLEFSTGLQAKIVGKPETSFFLACLNQINLEQNLNILPEETLMIGDDPLDDVNGAIQAGLNGLLVRTGKYKAGDEKFCPQAFHQAENIDTAVDFLIENVL